MSGLSWRLAPAAAALVLGLAGPLQSEESSADLLRDHLYAGTSVEIADALDTRAATGDADAAFGAGLVRFVAGVEEFAQAMTRHGFDAERGLARTPLLGGGMVAPEDENRDVEPLRYEMFRAYLEAFVVAMDEAGAALLMASEDTGFAVELDVMRIRLDLDGDGVGGEDEAVGAMLFSAALMGSMVMDGSPPDVFTAPEAVFAFDGSDAIWLAGYANILATQADFLLAHDFSESFNAAWHLLFPEAGLPMQEHAASGTLFFDRDSDTMIADAIAAIHTLNWPVIDADRLIGVRERLGQVTQLSRRHWDATLAETDDHLEFIPGPHQTPVHEGMEITKEMVEAWRDTLDVLDRILAGALLLPHWRFAGRGFDLGRYFETAARTDLVMIFTGYGALPFLAEGQIASEEDFAMANAVFGDSIWGYALWFN